MGNKKIFYIAVSVLVIVLVASGIIFIAQKNVDARNDDSADSEISEAEESIAEQDDYYSNEKWAEGTITYDGKQYKYNNKLKSYLFMGVDKDTTVDVKASDYLDGGQSDAMFLLVADPTTKTMQIIAINRNTITDVDMYDAEGTNLGSYSVQICLAHGYGDGKRVSCGYAVDAVENLFYDIPISGYMALNIGGVPALNDYVGGVTVEVLPGLEYLGDSSLVTGETVTLTGQQAYNYLRGRDTSSFGSANLRLARQQQYIDAYLPLLKSKLSQGDSEALNLYSSIEDYLVTNIDGEDLSKILDEYTLEGDEILTLEGETIENDEGFEEFHVDEDALYKLVIDVFYQEVEE